MNVRPAKISDAEAVFSLITYYAELDKMLFRSRADIYENLQTFMVVEVDGSVVGCCSLEIIWSDLSEIKSLAVEHNCRTAGLGRALVQAAVEQARRLGVARIFALTLEPGFFEKLGFGIIDKARLPMKVWSDCAKCPKQDHCDEIAVITEVTQQQAKQPNQLV